MHVCNLLEPEKAFARRFRTFQNAGKQLIQDTRLTFAPFICKLHSNLYKYKNLNFSRYRLVALAFRHLTFGFKQLHRPTYYPHNFTLCNLARGSFCEVHGYLFLGKFCYSTSSNKVHRLDVSFSARKVFGAVSAKFAKTAGNYAFMVLPDL